MFQPCADPQRAIISMEEDDLPASVSFILFIINTLLHIHWRIFNIKNILFNLYLKKTFMNNKHRLSQKSQPLRITDKILTQLDLSFIFLINLF